MRPPQIFEEEWHTLEETQGYSSPATENYRQQREQRRQSCYTPFTDQYHCTFETCYDYFIMQDAKRLCQVREEMYTRHYVCRSSF
jgi:hypothetical protein